MDTLPAWLQSSVDPTQPSLTIESFGKVLIGLAGVFAAFKGLNVQAATDQAQLFVDQGVMIALSGFTLYQALMTVYGLVRKVFMRGVVATQSAPASAPAADVASATQATIVPPQWEGQSVG